MVGASEELHMRGVLAELVATDMVDLQSCGDRAAKAQPGVAMRDYLYSSDPAVR